MAPALGQVRSLCELARLVDGEEELYVRWSEGPGADSNGPSRDDLTGVELPGLSAPPLAPEPWRATAPALSGVM